MTVQLTDHELIATAATGNPDAQSQLYQRYQPLLLGYLIRLLGSVPLAEDLCQDSFLKAFKALPSFRGEASFKNWLFMITKHRVADHWKQHYSHLTVSLEEWVGEEDEPPEDLSTATTNNLPAIQPAEVKLQQVLAQLPPDYREILEYRFLRGYSIKETAAALHLTESNAKVRQYRAIQLAKQINIL